jgi:Cu/Ag efflux pump CusA
MAIKNAIVMVDEVDLRMSQGGSRFDQLVNASSTRVRPVMMAALSTVLGMIPLISDVFFQGMAVTIMFGLTVASILTLIVLPTLYAIFFGIKKSEAVEFGDGEPAGGAGGTLPEPPDSTENSGEKPTMLNAPADD